MSPIFFFASVILASPPPPAVGGAALVTFSRDIAPLLQDRCQRCHRPGEAAPMSLLSYEDTRPWARSIKRAITSRKMPPWHADPAFGKWKNDCRLSDEEIAKITAWVDSGAPEGDPEDLPPSKKFVEGWNIGQPDLILSMPQEFRVKARGEVKYQYFAVPTYFKEDKWVQAAEARPGNRSVVHHILVFIQEPGKSAVLGEGREMWSSHLCGFVPGEDPEPFTPGTAKLIKANSILIFQVHYTPNGLEETDRSSVGLIFSKEPVRHRLVVGALINERFRIPPGAPDHQVKAQQTIDEDVTLLSVMPHMHLRGKSFRYDVVFPDGRKETLLNVPRYDFSWQHTYRFAEPLKLPRGTRIECTAMFDNSPLNKANPDPTREVRWGDQTWEEMMLGFLTFTKEGGALREWAF